MSCPAAIHVSYPLPRGEYGQPSSPSLLLPLVEHNNRSVSIASYSTAAGTTAGALAVAALLLVRMLLLLLLKRRLHALCNESPNGVVTEPLYY